RRPAQSGPPQCAPAQSDDSPPCRPLPGPRRGRVGRLHPSPPRPLALPGPILYTPASIPNRTCRRAARAKENDVMAVPKRKTSPSRRGMRRSADALKKPTYIEDKDSGELRRPHHIDLKTGMYRGRQVFKVKTEV